MNFSNLYVLRVEQAVAVGVVIARTPSNRQSDEVSCTASKNISVFLNGIMNSLYQLNKIKLFNELVYRT